MLTKADDYPIHQTSEPIAYAGTDRNFYDRYFFNAQSPDGTRFMGGALGVYPHLNVMDGAFCWLENGVQRSVFVSRLLGMERMDTQVGPLSVEIVEPLKRVRVRLEETDGLSADLLFEGRHHPIEEPRFIWRHGPRTLMDVTRMTQNVAISGHVTVDGVRHDCSGWRGTRDRSWGVRQIGAADPQPPVPVRDPQFFWLWAPLNFERHALYFHTNDDAEGVPWNRSAVLVDLASGAETKLANPRFKLDLQPGGRRATSAVLAADASGGPLEVHLSIDQNFQMHGIGYTHPQYGHGAWRGDLDVQTERFDCRAADIGAFSNVHIQGLCAAELRLPDGSIEKGRGVLEQMMMGPHAPSGFKELYDLA